LVTYVEIGIYWLVIQETQLARYDQKCVKILVQTIKTNKLIFMHLFLLTGDDPASISSSSTEDETSDEDIAGMLLIKVSFCCVQHHFEHIELCKFDFSENQT
jgi:hypothetical protein